MKNENIIKKEISKIESFISRKPLKSSELTIEEYLEWQCSLML